MAEKRDFKVWFANIVPSREAFDLLPSRIAGTATPFTRATVLQKIEADAARWMKMIKGGLKPVEKANIRRAAYGDLKWCAYSMCEPPPPSLVKLIGILMDVKPARAQIKNKAKFLAAAQYVAENPGATRSRTKRAVGCDSRQIAEWWDKAEFKIAVDRMRQSAKNRLPKSGG